MSPEKKDDGLWYVDGLAAGFDSQEAADLYAQSRQPNRQSGVRLKPRALVVAAGLIALVAMLSQSGPKTYDSSDAKVMCEQQITSMLKSPSTATYSSSAETAITGSSPGPFSVRGHVDAQNGFGAMIRNRYACTLTFQAGSAYFTAARLF